MARYESSIQRVPTDEYGNIAAELPCIACGYNLYSLNTETVCPECGMAVGRSVMGDYLKYCNPNWVSKLATGTNLVVLGIVVIFLAAFLGGAMVSASNSRGGAAGAAIIMLIAIIVGRLLLVIGYFILTAREPTKASGDTVARLLARWCLFGSFLVEVFNQVAAMQVTGLSGLRLLGIMAIVGSVLQLVGLFALLVYLRQLARRVPDASLVTNTSIVLWGWVIAIIGMFVVGFAAGASRGSGQDAAAGLACMGLIYILVLMIWSLVLTLWYGRVFTRASKEARSSWARAM